MFIVLASKKIVFLFAIAQVHWLPWQLRIYGKSENWHLLLSQCRYFDKGLLKYSLSSPLLIISFLSKLLNLIKG